VVLCRGKTVWSQAQGCTVRDRGASVWSNKCDAVWSELQARLCGLGHKAVWSEIEVWSTSLMFLTLFDWCGRNEEAADGEDSERK